MYTLHVCSVDDDLPNIKPKKNNNHTLKHNTNTFKCYILGVRKDFVWFHIHMGKNFMNTLNLKKVLALGCAFTKPDSVKHQPVKN